MFYGKVSMMRQWILGLTIALGALIPAQSIVAQDAPVLTTEEVERIVKDYLMREPEIIYEAIQEFQRRQQIAEQERQTAMLTTHAGAIFEDERDGVVNEDGDVTLVEFFDYRCGYCRSMAASMQTLLLRDPKLKFVLKEFPILGEDSMRAAKAALAAKQQGAYIEFHNALMGASDMSMASIERLANHYDLDVEQLVSDMESDEVVAHINDSLELGRQLGISGTPSFVLGETIIPGAAPVAQLAQMIAEERSKVSSN